MSAKILRHFTTDAEDSSHCHPLICMNHTTHHGFLYVIYCIQTPPIKQSKSFVLILHSVNAIKHKLANQSTIWANYIMTVKYTSNRNVCCMWKGAIMFQIILINDGYRLFINGILVGVKEEGGKLISVMMTLDPIPKAIIEVIELRV